MVFNYIMLGKRIRSLRKKRGLTQMGLSETIDCAATYLSYIENGRKSMSLATFVAIANALHVSADELLKDSLDTTVVVTNHELSSLLEDCSEYERRVLTDVIEATKTTLRSNRPYFLRK